MSEEIQKHELKNRPLERVFKNNIARLLDFFIINQDLVFSTNEISTISNIPLRTVQRLIPHLIEKNLIKEIITRSKKNKKYSLNKESNLVLVLNDYILATINEFISEGTTEQSKIHLLSENKNKLI